MNENFQTHDYIFSFGLIAMVAIMVTPALSTSAINTLILINLLLAGVVCFVSFKGFRFAWKDRFYILHFAATLFRLSVNLSLVQLFVKGHWPEVEGIGILPIASNKAITALVVVIAVKVFLLQISHTSKITVCPDNTFFRDTRMILAIMFMRSESLVDLTLAGVNFLATLWFAAVQPDMSLAMLGQWAQITNLTLLPCLLVVMASNFSVQSSRTALYCA